MEINPRLLYSGYFTSPVELHKGYQLESRYVYDYELELYLDNSDGKILYNNTYELDAKKGSINFRRPGDHVCGVLPYHCYIITFDLLDNTGKSRENYDFTRQHKFQLNYENKLLNTIPQMHVTKNYTYYLNLFENIFRNFINPKDGSELIIKSTIIQLLYNLYIESKKDISVSDNDPMVKMTLNYIENNVANKILIEDLAKNVSLSTSYFHYQFKEKMGISPLQYIHKVRIDHAKKLLTTSNMPIWQIALQCGFDNIPYFSFLFKKAVKISPNSYRSKYKYMNNILDS